VREHQHAGNAEHEEVEILGRAADDDAGSDFAGRSLFVRVGVGQVFRAMETASRCDVRISEATHETHSYEVGVPPFYALGQGLAIG
jgi:hypothetical protein